MHRVGATALGHGQQLIDVQVSVGRALAIEAVRLIGHASVHRVDVGVGVHRDGLHTIIGAGAQDAHGDLATVGDKNFLHGVSRRSEESEERAAVNTRMGLKRTCAPMGICPARSR
ncbi:hypothetical protein D3C81_1094290 [compost metagenome]